MDMASSFVPRLQVFALAMTEPTANAPWSIDQVGLALFDLVCKLTDPFTYCLVGDDTLNPQIWLESLRSRDAPRCLSEFQRMDIVSRVTLLGRSVRFNSVTQ